MWCVCAIEGIVRHSTYILSADESDRSRQNTCCIMSTGYVSHWMGSTQSMAFSARSRFSMIFRLWWQPQNEFICIPVEMGFGAHFLRPESFPGEFSIKRPSSRRDYVPVHLHNCKSNFINNTHPGRKTPFGSAHFPLFICLRSDARGLLSAGSPHQLGWAKVNGVHRHRHLDTRWRLPGIYIANSITRD